MRSPDARPARAPEAPHRYRQFLEEVVRGRQVWGLGDHDGWQHVCDAREQIWYPVWSRREHAEACALGNWLLRTPCALALDDFMKVWLPRSVDLGQGFLVYPTPVSAGVAVSAYELQLALTLALRGPQRDLPQAPPRNR